MTDFRFHTSRREFLSGSLGLLSAAGTLPMFLGGTVRALAGPDKDPAQRDREGRVLVVVQLAGGNDGLNTCVPYEMDPYYRLRPRLAVPKRDVLKLEDGIGLHPAATGLKELFDAGRMAVVQGVGYPNPNRSHFTSMDIWHTADPELRKHEGWLGRYFDACCAGSEPTPDPITGIALMRESPLAMQGEKFAPLSFENPDSLAWRAAARDRDAAATFRQLQGSPATASQPVDADENLAAYLERAALQAIVGAEQIRAAAGRELRSPGRRGGDGGALGRELQLVARMIAAELPTRVYYVSMGGFDTHTTQETRHRRLLTEFSAAMQDFVETLEADKLLDRVLIVTFSEFGRRAQENSSGGTDHGEAAPMFLFGSKVLPGLHQPHPDLGKLHRGDLAFGVDFRRVYATVLRHWLGIGPEKVIGGGHAPMRLLKNA